MKYVLTLILTLIVSLPATAQTPCSEPVHVGDKMSQVISKCGQPKWRERMVNTPGKQIEVIRALNSLTTHPVNPEVREKWYYVTGQDSTTVIEILDYGVLSVRELVREADAPAKME